MLEVTAEFSWLDWHGHPSILIGVLLLEGIYLIAVGPIRERYGLADGIDTKKVVNFSLGVFVIFIALYSPLHDLSDEYLFSAHMVQHLLITLIAPPLLIWGIPDWLARFLLNPAAMLNTVRFLVNPIFALVVFNATIAFWHFPVTYDMTMRNHGIHILEHIMFMAAAVMMWWPVLGNVKELPRLSRPVQLGYLFIQSLLPAIIGSILTFASTPLYQFYVEAPRLWGLSPLEDQLMGGLIMKMGGLILFWTAITIVFFSWVSREEKTENAGPNNQI